ncbi:hypothetical protein J2X36_002105 [Methylobacterium sp. BE186]|uniref:hypothetical protein n=1 Tax=Methylobacterium sp. BE186 TaxID=2817715 RepID=UPI002858B167|nr:hypothetical protein [Methylobacterium sp. BE186]MDR7037358.1 hypothetical protein [Methylobacterium sp. BE186]
MVGGKLIEIMPMRLRSGRDVLRLWVVETQPGYEGECAVFCEPTDRLPALGDTIWWQGREILFDRDRQKLRKVGYSFDPSRDSGGASHD